MMKKWSLCGLGILCVLVLAVGYGRSKTGIPARAEIAAMTDQAATEALAGTARETVLKVWGEPDGGLSGLFGDVYETEDEHVIIVYYNHSGEPYVVESVKSFIP